MGSPAHFSLTSSLSTCSTPISRSVAAPPHHLPPSPTTAVGARDRQPKLPHDSNRSSPLPPSGPPLHSNSSTQISIAHPNTAGDPQVPLQRTYTTLRGSLPPNSRPVPLGSSRARSACIGDRISLPRSHTPAPCPIQAASPRVASYPSSRQTALSPVRTPPQCASLLPDSAQRLV